MGLKKWLGIEAPEPAPTSDVVHVPPAPEPQREGVQICFTASLGTSPLVKLGWHHDLLQGRLHPPRRPPPAPRTRTSGVRRTTRYSHENQRGSPDVFVGGWW